MEGTLSVVALVAVVASAGAITFSSHFRQERAAEIRSWARERGWSYAASRTWQPARAALPLGPGGDPVLSHVLTGRHRSREVTAFEFTRSAPGSSRGTGEASRPTYCAVAVRAPGPCPDLRIHHRGPADPGPAATAFERAFASSGGDPDFTRAVLSSGTVAWLLADPRSRSLPVRFSGEYVFTWTSMRLRPRRVLTAADYLVELVDHIPAEAWQRRSPAPDPGRRGGDAR
ncbi:hypothetical protein [Nocardiopsis algeriensis]|uniref:Uncharacterized protein n=1 Tax=Nocardiopsis algeriensis TaxID=1478215 RepID=A0A841IKP1_9ACTN|nr:hypothetical protein [Nocardiopsis algeriensis]MBB6119223.1 hypothetical protein [Nocardiopsis algeriensis]